jgi:hypothetical protein
VLSFLFEISIKSSRKMWRILICVGCLCLNVSAVPVGLDESEFQGEFEASTSLVVQMNEYCRRFSDQIDQLHSCGLERSTR